MLLLHWSVMNGVMLHNRFGYLHLIAKRTVVACLDA